MEQIVVGTLSLVGVLAVGYWQWVYKPKHREEKPDYGERALDDLFVEKERLQRAIDNERTAHGVTRQEYMAVVQRLATVEAELKAAKRDVRERDDMITRLRVELAEVRRDIADIRRGYA